MPNLYQINDQIQQVIQSADENGVIDETAFEQLQLAKSDKQLNIIKFIKHLDNDVEVIKKEAERIETLKKQTEKRKEWLTNYLAQSMRIDGVNELDFTTFKAKFRKNPPRLTVIDEASLPQEYIVTKTVTSPDKDKIKEAIKSGQEIPGCSLEQAERLVIS